MGFEQSDGKIYGKMQLSGKFRDIAMRDYVSTLSPFSKFFGFQWKDGKLVRPHFVLTEAFNTPWCHAAHLAGKHCALDSQMIFNCYNVIHPRCMSCWKTVVSPKNFDELMTWYKLQNNGEIDFPCKCGIELRDYTPKHYGAYHYAHSLEEGREQYARCKELAEKHLSKETADGVLLKRACTEFELLKGPSNSWHLTDEEEHLITLIDRYVEFPNINKPQDKNIGHPHVQMRWLLFAHMNADWTYLPYNGDVPIFPGYVKYHEGDIQGIKHDIAILTAQAKHGHDPAITDEFLKSLTEYSKYNNIPMEDLRTPLGHDYKPNMGRTNYTDLYDVEPKTIGEDDVQPDGTE